LALLSIKITDFRCLASAQASFDASANLIVGPNAAGKTSLLEAIAYLGRGRSFRGASVDKLVRHGQKEFVLFGVVDDGEREHRLGVRNSRAGLDISVNGESGGGLASLAENLPLQIIDPDVHNLVAGGPDERRRYLDWLGFHVEHRYLDAWRCYSRTLRQRNATLKDSPRPDALAIWDRALAETGGELHQLREECFALLEPVLAEVSGELVQSDIGFSYRRGWAEGQGLAETLAANRERDLAAGSTSSGPHRADIALKYDDRQARKLVSRGQQKLLSCAMILGGVEVVQEIRGVPLLLLLDDPAAELDGQSLGRLMAAVESLGCQVVATALSADTSLFSTPPRMFHVEQGELRATREPSAGRS